MDSIVIDIIRKIESGKIPVDNTVASCKTDKGIQDELNLFQKALKHNGFPKISHRTILRACLKIVRELETNTSNKAVIEMRSQLETAQNKVKEQKQIISDLSLKLSQAHSQIYTLKQKAASQYHSVAISE